MFRTALLVELSFPNDLDKHYKLYTLYEKGCEKRVAISNSRGDASIPTVKWVGNDVIQYQFEGEAVKETKVKPQKKDYLEFLY